MEDLRNKVRRVIYAFGSIILLLILARFFLRLIGASAQNPLINLVYQLSYPLVVPFRGIAQDSTTGSVSLEFTSIIALLIWFAFIIIIAELVTSFLYENFREVFVNIVDAMFKFIEFFLLARLLMRAFGVHLGVNEFVDIIYAIAGIVYTPFAGIAPGINVGIGVIEISTLIALVIVIGLDVVSDGILKSLVGEEKPKSTSMPANIPPSNVYINQQPASQPQQPQINVIVPQSYPQGNQPSVIVQPVMTREQYDAAQAQAGHVRTFRPQ